MNITENTVAICMATYNGEKYIAEQIDSIVKQTGVFISSSIHLEHPMPTM